MLTTTSVARSGYQDIDGLLYSLKWVNTNFTFSFPTSTSTYQTNSAPLGELNNHFEALTAVQQAGVRLALQQYSSVANLTFTEMTETTTQHANMRFAESDATATAWAYLPSSGGSNADVWFSHDDEDAPAPIGDGSGSVSEGDAWFNNSRNYFESPVKGNYAFHTFVHEIGHTLGLVHGHTAGNVYGALPSQHDSIEYSVMTYRTYVGGATSGYTYETWGAPQSLMQDDIAAIQYLYGANHSYNGGDTVYRWDASTGQEFVNGVGQGAPGANRVFMTVWDGGGIDTYDFSNYASNLSIDLRPGAWTTLSSGQLVNLGLGHKAVGNIANALLDPNHPTDLSSLIDNALGGSGNDTFYTNDVANRLSGLGGADHFVITGVNADASCDRITDYDQGNAGAYRLIEGDVIDLAALLSNTSGQPIEALVRVVMDASGTFATLQVDRDGAANGANWIAAVRLDGLHAGNRVQVITDASDQATSLAVLDCSGKQVPDANKPVRDFHGDGTSDLLLQNDDGSTSVWLMNGSVKQGEIAIGNNGPTWHAVAAADFNDDDKADVLWQNDDGSTAVWLMNGTTKVGEANLQNNGASWHAMAATDFNGDGKADILWQNDDGRATLWLMDGVATAQAVELQNNGPTWHVKAAADFNGDGKADILWQNDNGSAAVWLMDGAKSISEINLQDNGPTWHVKSAADFNGDGKADILWQNDNGSAAIWLMDGAAIMTGDNLQENGPQWHAKAGADFNGDGKADILWQHDAGYAAIWLMDGTKNVGDGNLDYLGTGWHLL